MYSYHKLRNLREKTKRRKISFALLLPFLWERQVRQAFINLGLKI